MSQIPILLNKIEIKDGLKVSYGLRRVPVADLHCLLPCSDFSPQVGDVALAQLEKIGKNARLELSNGRRANLYEGDMVAVVFGNRYATRQFEGYARAVGDHCDLLSMGGLCGIVESKHASVLEPSKLRLLGLIGDPSGNPVRLHNYSLEPKPVGNRPGVIVVCGTSMDSGKTFAAMSLIVGLRQHGSRVAGMKLTGTAAGTDRWNMLDAGACAAFDFIDGGLPSTYLCSLEQLLGLYDLLLGHASFHNADWVVLEIADGLLQRETAALLQSQSFTRNVDAWVFTAGEPIGAAGGISILKGWGITPIAISGLVSMSPLCVREAQTTTGIPCLTAKELQLGELNSKLADIASKKILDSVSV